MPTWLLRETGNLADPRIPPNQKKRGENLVQYTNVLFNCNRIYQIYGSFIWDVSAKNSVLSRTSIISFSIVHQESSCNKGWPSEVSMFQNPIAMF